MAYTTACTTVQAVIDIPTCLLRCNGHNCTNSVHREHIDRYYSRFIDVVYRSAAAFAQRSTDRLTRTPALPGWSDYVQDNYDKAKEAYVCWVQRGKPRCGLEYDAMYKTRATLVGVTILQEARCTITCRCSCQEFVKQVRLSQILARYKVRWLFQKSEICQSCR